PAHKTTSRRRATPPRNLAKRETGDAGGRMIADRRAKEPRRRAAKPAVAAEHQNLCSGLVNDRERIAFAVPRCDNPARELNHRAGHFLAARKLVDGGHPLRGGIVAAGPAEARGGCTDGWDGPRERRLGEETETGGKGHQSRAQTVRHKPCGSD